MITILICIPCLLTGGTEIQTLNLVQALIQAGNKVVTLCYYEYSSDMVSRYRQAGSEVVLLNPQGVRYRGIKQVLFLLSGFKKVVHQFRPDVAHVQYMAPGALAVLLLRLLGVKTILATSHTAADIYPRLGLLHFLQRHCLRAFLCVTRRSEESFFGESCVYGTNCLLAKRNHFTLYNALSPQFATPPVSRDFRPSFTIGVVSRLERIKGMDMVIPAFAQLLKHSPECRLIIVGDGSLRDEMKRQSREWNITDSIDWKGRRLAEELPALYDRIDVLWMPSRSEGFGLTALEAMSRGCLVVAANVGGLPEVVRDTETGRLHAPGSGEDLVNKTREILSNHEQRHKMSQKAIEVARTFSFTRYSTLIKDMYGKMVESCKS